MSVRLALAGVHTHIGRYHILQGVDFDAPEGATTMLLGRNGAGKTTTAAHRSWACGAPRAARSRSADARSPALARERRRARRRRLCARRRWRSSPISACARIWCSPRATGRSTKRGCNGSSASSRRCKKFWLSRAGSLSGGQKQMVSIARAIIEPRRLLLIDEPTKGLAPAIIGGLIDCLKEIKRARRRRSCWSSRISASRARSAISCA